MKKTLYIAAMFLIGITTNAQVGTQVSIGTTNPNPSSILELASTSKGFLPPRLSTAQRNAIVSPAVGLMIYNTTRNCLEWYNGTVWYNGCAGSIASLDCSGTTNSGDLTSGVTPTGVSSSIAYTGGNGGTHTGQVVASTGVLGLTATLVAGSFAVGSGSLTYTITGIPSGVGTALFAVSIGGKSCSLSRTVTTGKAICDGTLPTTIVEITSTTGKIWMDRNLGASRAGTSLTDYKAYGCLYQWGRGNDGHASITWTSSTAGTAVNGTTTTLSATDSPGHALFITPNDVTTIDWRSPQNNFLWGLSGINNPCPAGFRLPTDVELTAEVTAYGITNSATAYASIHKFVSAGYRHPLSSIGVGGTGTLGGYWSSTKNGPGAFFLEFISTGSIIQNLSSNARAYGFSVRCLKD